MCQQGMFKCRDTCVDNALKDLYCYTDGICSPKKIPTKGNCTDNWVLCGNTCIPDGATCRETIGNIFS